MASTKGTPMYEFYSNVQAKEVEWLWYPYIPYGKLTVLQGDPGEGKSTFMLNLTAILSTGGKLPTGEKFDAPQAVIYQCAEDSPADGVVQPSTTEAKSTVPHQRLSRKIPSRRQLPKSSA